METDSSYPPLQLAVLYNRVTMIPLLIDAGADPNMLVLRDSEQIPLMHLVAKKHDENKEKSLIDANTLEGWRNTIAALIEAGVDINAKASLSGDTALHRAVCSKNIDLIGLLIEAGADYKAENYDGKTAKELARGTYYKNSVTGEEDRVLDVFENIIRDNKSKRKDAQHEELIALRGEVSRLSSRVSELEKEVESLKVKSQTTLKASGPNKTAAPASGVGAFGSGFKFSKKAVGSQGSSFIFGAKAPRRRVIRGRRRERVTFFQHGELNSFGIQNEQAKQSKKTQDLLVSAVEHGRLYELKRLFISSDADLDHVDEYGWTLLRRASYHGYNAIVETLIGHGATVDYVTASGATALITACKQGRTNVVRTFVLNGADVNRTREGAWSALMHSCYLGNVAIVSILLENDANVNYESNDGFAALMLASEEGHTDIVRMLHDHGAEVNHVNHLGESALISASVAGHNSTVFRLIDYKADLNQARNDGWSAWMLAEYHGHRDTAHIMLNRGANVNQVDEDGWTMLMYESKLGDVNNVRTLIKCKADVNHTANDGMTALMSACLNGNYNVARILIDAGADVDVNARTEGGKSLLYFAVQGSNLEFLTWLVEEKNININASDKNILVNLAADKAIVTEQLGTDSIEYKTCMDIIEYLKTLPVSEIVAISSGRAGLFAERGEPEDPSSSTLRTYFRA